MIELVTSVCSPKLYSDVELKAYNSTNVYSENIEGERLQQVKGQYSNGSWSFNLCERVAERCNLLVFELSSSELVRVPLVNGEQPKQKYFLSEFSSWQWLRLGPIPEYGQAHNKDFDFPKDSQGSEYEVIIIGSGMAGGVLADRLSDSGIKTLVLEAGGAPFETHIANLPRRQRKGFQKHIWERWFDFRVKNCDSGSNNDYTEGYQGFNLGGRSVFWGGFIPRMTSAELDYWPNELKWDLEDRYYQLAEEIMGRSSAPLTEFTRSVHKLLRKEFRDYSHFDAPMAIDKSLEGSNTISSGVFSTADLLLESHRSNDYDDTETLTIYTHQLAINVEPGEMTTVTTRDIVTGELNKFIGKFIVLSCGCIESARLAKRSGIGNENVGRGVTDHPIAYTHFRVPPYKVLQSSNAIQVNSHYSRYGNVKVVSQKKTPQSDLFNMLLELGADFNQGRYIDDDIYSESVLKQDMLCEVVFLTNVELNLDNYIEFDEDNDYRPIAHVKNLGLNSEFSEELRRLRDSVLNRLNGEIISEGWGDGSLGFVAHEVGSLHMEVTDSNNIKFGKQTKLRGVVDCNGKFLDQDFIYACDLSIFPTSPAANPSLTAVALAIRLGDHLIDRVRSL